MLLRDSDYVQLQEVTFRGPAGPLFPETTLRLAADERWVIRGPGELSTTYFLQALLGRLPRQSGTLRHPFLASEPRCADSIYGVFPPGSIALTSMAEHRSVTAARGFHQLRWHASLAEDALTVADFLSQARVERRTPFALGEQGDTQRYERAFSREVARFELQALLPRPLLGLSNGELHRVLLARALLLDPKLLVVHEPFAGLDRGMRERLRALLTALPEQGTGVLYAVSREQDVLESTTHEVLLSDGAVTYAGPRRTPKSALRARPLFEARHAAPPGDSSLPPVLRFRDVTVRRGAVALLSRLTWEIRPGERWALLGPNGAGKSTLLSLALADNPQAYCNDVELGGHRLGPGTSIWTIKRLVGWLSPELEAHYPSDATLLEVVESGFRASLGLHGEVSDAQRELALEELRRLGLDALRARPLGDVPALARRLALLGRALVTAPKLLLLDEPCQGLDEEDRLAFCRALEHPLHEPSLAWVFVTHEEGELPPSISHVLRLEAGRVLHVGPRGPSEPEPQ